MACLDPNDVQDLMSGALDDSMRATAVQHLDSCDDCRNLVSLLAKDATRDAAVATLHGGKVDLKKLALQQTEAPDQVRTVASGARERPTPDPLAVTADVSLIQKSGTRQIGKTFGKYTLVDRIGAGAMGVVYRAEDPALNRKVALKLLHKPDKSLAQRLVREAQSMAQVNHPNVVQVYDAGIAEDESTYIAMELISGSSLRTWQQEKRPIAEIVEAYLAAGRGLAAAHGAGIIHRDFKPDNCLIGTDGRVRVTDFGLASARPNDDGPDTPEELELTNSGMVLGTPAYMAPEQFTGGNVDPRTDQFNYCVALYEALYGVRPFKGKSFDELGDNVCDGKIRPAPAGSRVSGAMREILIRGLSVKPGDRYPTMDHLLDDLGRDRARVWRNTGFVAAAFAAALGLGLFADFVVRDRVSASNSQSFDATGVQIDRAFALLVDRLDANTNQMYYQAAINDVRSNRDQSEFGFGDENADQTRLREIHDQLRAQDWTSWRIGSSLQLAIVDYKQRLLFSTLVPDWPAKTPPKLDTPWIKRAFSGTEKTLVLQTTDPSTLPTADLFGPKPPFPLALCFGRALVGSGETKEISGALVQSIDAAELIDEIRLDDKMLLSIVTNDGGNVGQEIPAPVIAAARDDSVVEIVHDGKPYQVRRQPLTSLEDSIARARWKADLREGKPVSKTPPVPTKPPVGYVVMARELGGVLSGLFQNARMLFAFAALAALVIAIGTWVRVRQLTR
jgi:serine/threonine protein kinase